MLSSNVLYFISGSNHAGEIRGLALTGNDLGICACDVNESALVELESYAGGPLKVFVDSGAFGEVSFPGGVPTISKPITHSEWIKRLDLYTRLARSLRHQLYVVAPDCVAHQAETLQRLTTYRDQILAIRALGANVIVPVQKGAVSMTAFREAAIGILGDAGFIWGIPMKKDATSIDELADFSADLHATTERARIHLLGMGLKSRDFQQALGAVWFNAPTVILSCDSVRITAMVGRTNGPGGGPRVLTAERDRLLVEGVDGQEWQGMTGTALVKYAMVQRVFTREARTEVQEARRNGWFDDELESAPGVPLEEGCIEYGPGGPFGEAA